MFERLNKLMVIVIMSTGKNLREFPAAGKLFKTGDRAQLKYSRPKRLCGF